MIFWIISISMLALAVMCILVPLAKRENSAPQNINPIDVYKQQLVELEQVANQSDIVPASLEQERAEISRRIIRESRKNSVQKEQASNIKFTRFAGSLAALLLLPVLTISTYLFTGSPHLSSGLGAPTKTETLSSKSLEEMVIIAERHLAKNPDDAKGWKVLAGVYGRINRPADKARALEQIMRLGGSTPETLVDLGEALTVANGNIVPQRARKIFDTALSQQPTLTKASFYLAIAVQQEGRDEDALVLWEKLANQRKDDIRWQQLISQRINELRLKLGIKASPGPTLRDVENASSLSQEDRMQMIEGMVEGLAARLKESPNDIDGWLRLIRSLSVLKKDQRASDALAEALKIFDSEAMSKSKLLQLADSLNLAPTTIDKEVK